MTEDFGCDPERWVKRVTRDLEKCHRRASFVPDTLDEEKRTVDVVWTTGARVMRGFFERFWEELSLKRSHVRMDRLKNGAPLLDLHNGFENEGVIGVVESARLEKDQGVATVRFSDDPVSDAIFRKVKAGILRAVSVGYRVHKFEKVEEEDDKIPVYRATDWEPMELSFVPIGADAGAQARSDDGARTYPCEFVSRGVDMSKPNKDQKPTPTPDDVTRAPDATADVETAKREAQAAEKTRSKSIRSMVRDLGLDETEAEKMIDGDVSLDEARALAIEMYAGSRADAPVEKIDGKLAVEVGEDLTRKGARDGVRNAVLHRADPTNELDDVGRAYRGMTLLEQARGFLEAHGIRTAGMSKMDLAGAALGMSRAGGHSTSDFPLLLADVANKTLRRAYEEAPQTFQSWARRVTLPDFKEVKRVQFGEAPQLLEVKEGGEFTRGTIGEGQEKYQLATYGRVFAVTRQTLINDDLDAFTRIPERYGRSARDLESDLVYDHFLANPNMGDGVALFHTNHGNLGTGAISIAAIGSGRENMRKQTGRDGKQRINVQARMILVPAALETIADQFVSTNLRADQAGNINPFAGRLQSIAEPRLDDNSAVAWYLAGDPAAVDTLEYAYLEGETGPRIESRVGFDIDGLEIKARHDFGVKVIDHRGFYKSSGV